MRDRSEADFEQYVEQRSARLVRTAYLLCRDWATAEDLVQTALARAWLAWGRVGELLERDSQDGPYRGVTVADVGRRVRRIRRRRVQVLGSLTAAAAAVVMAAWLPSAGTAPAPAGVWTGELAQPTPTRTISLAPLYFGAYERGGTRETFSAVWAPEVRKAGFWITCEPAAHVLIWVNGELVDDGPCEVGPRPPARVAGGIPVRAGERNEFAVALIPETVAGATAKGAEWAAEALSRTAPYPLRWRVDVVDDSACLSRHVVEPGSGKVIRWGCALDCPLWGAASG